MGRPKTSGSILVNNLPGKTSVWHYEPTTNKIQCKKCDNYYVDVDFRAKTKIEKHCTSEKHKRSLELARKRQTVIQSGQALSKNEFWAELTTMLVRSNIPISSVEGEDSKQFMEKWTKKVLPSESTLRKNYLEGEYLDQMKKIKNAAENKDIYIIVDETTDVRGKAVAAVLIGILGDDELSKPQLFNVVELERTNATTITQIVNTTFMEINGCEKYEKLRLFMTDAASYMIKAGSDLKSLYPNLLHVTCMAHGVQRVVDLIRENHPYTDELVANMKAIFTNCSRRKRLWTEKTELPLPPEPVIVRWNTWLKAALFYCDNFEKTAEFLESLEDESSNITSAKNLIKDPHLFLELAYLKGQFSHITSVITQLQERVTLDKAVQLVQDFKNTLTDHYAEKFDQVLLRNPDWQRVLSFGQILLGTFTGVDKNLVPADAYTFKNAPIVSVDVERCFSYMNRLLSPQRQRLTTEHIRWYLVIMWNHSVDANKSD